MRKFTLLVFSFFTCLSLNAQISFEATPEYGKLWDITYDNTVQNKVYALTLVNHLMVSEDNGATWKILYTFPSDNGYLDILKIAPGNKELSFIIKNTGNPQTDGLYFLSLATDSITKHIIAPNFADNPQIVSYSIYDERAQTILLHTSYQVGFANFTKVFYTNDGGNNWEEIYFSGDYDDVQINNAAMNPADSSQLFLARGLGPTDTDGGLFVSNDAGTTWQEKLKGKPVDPIAFHPGKLTDILVGSAISFGDSKEKLYQSVDGGETWKPVKDLPLHDVEFGLNNITTIAYDPTNTNIIWLLDENEILKTTDGGNTWNSKVFDVESTTYYYGTNITISPFDGNELIITSDGWPQYSNDGGNTLTQVKNPFYNIVSVAFANYSGTQHLYYGSQGGYFDKNLGTGETSAYLVESPFIVNGHTRFLFPDTTVAGRVFVFTPGDGFFTNSVLSVSDDYGATLTQIPGDEFALNVRKIEKDPAQSSVYWVAFAGFDGGTLYRIDISDISNPLSEQITLPGVGFVSGVHVSPLNSQTVYLSQGTDVYKSENSGASWNKKSKGLKDLVEGVDVIWDMENNALNSNEFILATSKGLYISHDTADTWELSLGGYETRKVNFSPVVNGHIIAGIYSSEVSDCQLVYTTDGGAAWKNILPEEIKHVQAYSMDFNFKTDSVDIYLGTVDLGVVKYSKKLEGVLPLQLISFSGSLKNNDALLSWNTTNEQMLLNFQLERSLDSRNFQTIHTMSPANTPGAHQYTHTDNEFSFFANKHASVFYRLKITDIDGRITYSQVVKLSSANFASSILIYPNPVSSTLYLKLQTQNAGRYLVKIIDMQGRQYYSSTYSLPQGNTSVQIPVNTLSKGVYQLALQHANGKTDYLIFVK